MSSDVYIDFNEDKDGADYDRVGHLGLLSYYDTNLLEQIRTLVIASEGIVTSWLPEAMERIFANFEKWISEVNDNPFLAGNAYEVPNDFMNPASVKTMFQENMGKTWQVRID
jgi:hypothetical protein